MLKLFVVSLFCISQIFVRTDNSLWSILNQHLELRVVFLTVTLINKSALDEQFIIVNFYKWRFTGYFSRSQDDQFTSFHVHKLIRTNNSQMSVSTSHCWESTSVNFLLTFLLNDEPWKTDVDIKNCIYLLMSLVFYEYLTNMRVNPGSTRQKPSTFNRFPRGRERERASDNWLRSFHREASNDWLRSFHREARESIAGLIRNSHQLDAIRRKGDAKFNTGPCSGVIFQELCSILIIWGLFLEQTDSEKK